MITEVEDFSKRKQRWDSNMKEYPVYSPQLATYELEVENLLGLLGEKRSGLVLDIGCGFGNIDVLLAQKTDFQIIGCDISDFAVSRARANVANASLDSRITIEDGDVYNLKYPDSYFDIVISFGYTSAATYKGAQGEVARVLKPGGLLVCDFVNPSSIYKIYQLPKRWNKFRKEEGKYYNILTANAIEKYFSNYNFQFISQKFFNTYPPLGFVPENYLILFEKSAGRFLNRFLGRVRIVCFQKV